ncbi:hypothetical protein JCM17960_00160 [Magnetospira thiophila]
MLHPRKLRLFILSGLGALFLGIGTAAATVPDKAEIQQLVVEEALHNGTVPPSLALGVAKVESGFDARAESRVGARGVMQIMPATARGEFQVSADSLWDARTNIRLGVTYLERLYRQYGNRWDAALSHYNGGTLKDGRPHDYTRRYVADVMAWARRFERDRTAATLVADAGTMPPADAVASSPAPYWLFEEPGIERNWRDYLKTADRWLKDPKGARLPEAEPFRDVWEPPSTNTWTPVSDTTRPSEQLRQKIQDFRRGILNRINEAPDHKSAPRVGPRFG